MDSYPIVTDEKDVLPALQQIGRQRNDDVIEFDNIKNAFMRGRKVGKIPAGSTDVSVTDRVGDFNFDTSRIYIAVETTASTLTWRIASLSTF